MGLRCRVGNTRIGCDECVFDLVEVEVGVGGWGVGALEGAELMVYDLRNGLSATMNSGADNLFSGGPKMSKNFFWGQKWLEEIFAEHQAHDDFSGPPRCADSKKIPFSLVLWTIPSSKPTPVRTPAITNRHNY